MTRHSASATGVATTLNSNVGFVVHSHLRWDFVWQRPQQLLSRIAANNPVLFVEEPLMLDDAVVPSLDLTTPHAGVIRAVPHLPASAQYGYDDAIIVVRRLIQSLLASPEMQSRFECIVQWFYTPMPAPAMLAAFNEDAVVYDCMDELAQFRFAPTDIGLRERRLLARADVVFTGGHRLFESKSRFHDNVHFFGCGVDVQHFGKARLADTVIPEDAARLSKPVLGYFGVIDERLDYNLIRALAEARRDWSVLMIGPVVKVDPRELPHAENIYWLGQRPYADLPRYLKAFDVCLMPFALNEATEYINPTKTLEYMAAGKPIVSTAVADVVHNFTPIVRIANDATEFVEAASEAVAQPNSAMRAAGIERANGASWEAIVEQMRALVGSAVEAERETRARQRTALQNDVMSGARVSGWRARGRAMPSRDHSPEPGGAAT
jgi:glycosyltransferase involved in cell wall biosynthesis